MPINLWFFAGYYSLSMNNSRKLGDLPNHLRPRERIQVLGAEHLSDNELLAVVFGRGTAKSDALSLANELISYLNTQIATPTLADLSKFHGVGPSKACQVLAVLELSRRFLLCTVKRPIRTPADVLPCLAAIRQCDQEKVAVVTLDGGHQVIATHIVTVGLANQSQIHPRETFWPAIHDRAVSIVVAHNHPSGQLSASDADLLATKRLSEAAKTLGIPMLDHLIVTKSDFLSIRESHPEYFV